LSVTKYALSIEQHLIVFFYTELSVTTYVSSNIHATDHRLSIAVTLVTILSKSDTTE